MYIPLKRFKWLLNSLFVLLGNIKIIKQISSLTGMAGFCFIFLFLFLLYYVAKADLELNHGSECFVLI